MHLEGGEDGGVVTGGDVISAAIGSVADASAGVGAPHDTVAIGRHVYANLHVTERECVII